MGTPDVVIISHADSCIGSVEITRSVFKSHQMGISELRRLNPMLNVASSLLPTHAYLPQSQRWIGDREDFGLIPAESHDMIVKDTQTTELRSVPKSPYLASPNRRKLFILKDQVEFFCLLVCVLKKRALVFSTYCQVDTLFVSACYCVLPRLFNTSWVSILWYFYTSVF